MDNDKVNKILKSDLSDNFEYSMMQVYCSCLGKIPAIYILLYQSNKLSLSEYNLIKLLWNNQFVIESEPKNIIIRIYRSTKVEQYRESFRWALKKLTKYGIIECSKVGSIIHIELSTVIFSKVCSSMSSGVSIPDLFQVSYLGDFDIDYSEYTKFCENMNQLPVARQIAVKYERIPVIGLRKPLLSLREPIVGLRKSIISGISTNVISNKNSARKIDFSAKKYEGLSDREKKQIENMSKFGKNYADLKLKQIQNLHKSIVSENETECLYDFIPYYNNSICKATNKLSYDILKGQGKLSKFWNSIYKCYSMCKDNNWDWKIYIDAQFDSYVEWSEESKSKFPFPMPSMLISDRAVKAYENYVYHNETALNNEGWNTKLKAVNVGKYEKEMCNSIDKDLEMIEIYVNKYRNPNHRVFSKIDRNRKDIESLYLSKVLFDRWDSLSIETWSVIPEMTEFLDSIYGQYPSIDAKIDEYRELQENYRKLDIIHEYITSKKLPVIYSFDKVNEILGS